MSYFGAVASDVRKQCRGSFAVVFCPYSGPNQSVPHRTQHLHVALDQLHELDDLPRNEQVSCPYQYKNLSCLLDNSECDLSMLLSELSS